VFVADWHNDRIQKFSAEGSHLKTIGSPGGGEGQLKRPAGVAVDSAGYIYVADWGNERVQIFDEDGSFVAIMRGQATVSKWAMDYFSSNPEEWEVRQASELESDLPEHLNTPYLISSQTEPYFWGPVSLRFDHQDRLYVVETNRHRFQVYAKG
jgi:DNA-binding beta-propeller fold protein YncE